ncbi:AAA family ATPase [Saccharococcus caldoxylosilyticus]|uniref:AAA family ATPase n=1 Tax=Saccharococcus caldoxylosilyticus TaxID=81408 RepID=UPI000303116F|nr:SMC family ATPase [Parageobacillus caldoxylosilyticus]
MKINKLKIKNFRLFRGYYEFDFSNKELIIIEGPNGHGKSTIFDAIEWCITGEIKRYKGSREPSKFNFLINHEANLSEEVEMFVELELKTANGKTHTIKRLLSKNRSKPKGETTLIINEKNYSVTEGNEKICELISKKIEDTFVNYKSEDTRIFVINPKNMIDLFSATQILSQDELSDFVLAKKPQDRFVILERILGLDKYGEAFRKYLKIEGQDKLQELLIKIKEKKENLSKKKINIDKKLYEVSVRLKNLQNRFEISEGVTEDYIINQIYQTLKQIDQNVVSIHKESKISKELESQIINVRKEIIKKIEKYQSIRDLLEESKTIFRISIDDLLKKKSNYQDMLINFQKKINIRKKALSKYESYEKNFNHFKNIRKIYIDEKSKYEQLNTDISKLKEKIKKYDTSDLLNEIRKSFDNLNSFIIEYKNEIKNQIIIKNCLDIYQHNKKIDENKSIINNLNQQIQTLILDIKIKEDKIKTSKNQLRNIIKIIENQQTDFINQIVYDIQSYLINEHNNETKCPVCGSIFEDHESLVKAIKSKMKVNIEKLDKLEQKKINITNQVNNLEYELARTKKELITKQEQFNDIKKNIECLQSKIEELKIEVPEKWRELTFEQLVIIKDTNEQFLNRFKLHYQLATSLLEAQNSLNTLIRQADEKSKILNKLIREVHLFKVMLNNTDEEINNKELKLNKNKMKLQQIIEDYQKNIYTINNKLDEINKYLLNRSTKLEEIKKIAPLSTDSYSEIESYIIKLDQKLLQYKIHNKKLKVLQNKVNTFLSQKELLDLRNLQEKLEKISGKYKLMDEKYNETYNRFNRYIEQFEIIKNNSKNIQSNLISKIIKKYNSVIDRLFFQISPHAFKKHVNLIARNGNLYIILSENHKEELFNLPDEQLYYESNASLTLSSAQANVLAVCIFLALNTSQNWTKLNFLGIDDPFQNMDDINVFSFIDTLSSLRKENQIFISTHSEEFANLIKRKSGLDNAQIGYINLRSYSKERIDYIFS